MNICNVARISFFKSLIVNLKLFGLRGIKLPILVSRKCRIDLHGKVQMAAYSTGQVTIGFGGSKGVVENAYSYFGVAAGATVVFAGKAGISAGSSVRVDKGTLRVGKNFSTNKNCFIACSKGVTIGNDVTLGWNVNIRDNDGHNIIDVKTSSVSESKPVTIGNHVWLCSYVDVLKGAYIADDNVVAYRSLVTKSFEEKSTLIGGAPAKIIKTGVRWEY